MSSPATPLDPAILREERRKRRSARPRDLADSLGVPEAALVAAQIGADVIRLDPRPDQLLAKIPSLGAVMGLTRNDDCVIEHSGRYGTYDGGLVEGADIRLELEPEQWAFAFAQTEKGKRSLQVYDPAGDAVHKVHLDEGSEVAAYNELIDALRHPEQTDRLPLSPREPAAALPVPADAVALAPACATPLLQRLAETGAPVRLTVANPGCRQSVVGPVANIVPTGPWINVLDPGLNLHLREDRIARAWQSAGTVTAVAADGIPIVTFAVEDEAVLKDLPRA